MMLIGCGESASGTTMMNLWLSGWMSNCEWLNALPGSIDVRNSLTGGPTTREGDSVIAAAIRSPSGEM